MVTTRCTACGADSATADYCDSCGAPLAAAVSSTAPAPAPSPAVEVCPNCGAARTVDDTFCESCGLDFATGQLPAAPAPPPTPTTGAPSGWVAVIEADKEFFDTNQVTDAAGAKPAFPPVLAPREVALTGDEVVIGRRSESKGFFPGVDLSEGASDPGVSRRHALLRRQADGTWALIDEMSTNGTFLNGADNPLDHGVAIALHDKDHIRLGAFTRITFSARRSTP